MRIQISTAALAIVGCGVTARPILPATVGLHRVVRFERHQSVDGDKTGSPPAGCWRIALDERVVKATADREFEIDALVAGGNDPSCGLGCRVTIFADRQAGSRVQVVKEGPAGCGSLIAIAQSLHARMGMRNGPFVMTDGFPSDSPLDHPLGKVRVGGVDYRAYGSEEHEDREKPYRLDNHKRSIMHVRLQDRRLACFSFKQMITSENPETGGGTSTYDESLDIDYGDHALSPCP